LWCRHRIRCSEELTVGEDWHDGDPQWCLTAKRSLLCPIARARNSDEAGTGTSGSSDAAGAPVVKISQSDNPTFLRDGLRREDHCVPQTRLSAGHPKIWLASSQGGAAPRLAIDGLD